MSLDAEEQDDELLALSSIYEESFTFSLGPDGGPADGQSGNKGGELAISLDLPPDFVLLTKHIDADGEFVEQKHYAEHLPPIYLHFTYPATYPSQEPPSFTLSCKWLTRAQLTGLCEQLDSLWRENEGSVVMFTWVQFLKDESLHYLGMTNTLDLETMKRGRHPSGASNNCGLVRDEAGEEASGATPNGENNCDISVSCGVSSSDSASASSHTVSRHSYDSRAIQDIGPKTNMLRLLRDYDEEMRRKVFNTKTFECKVCFIEKLGQHCLEFWPCRHVYCKDCMSSYFSVQISEGNIKLLRCPEHECESEANPKQVQELVPEELYKKWDEMLLNSTLSSLGDIQPCPRFHCQYPVTVEDGQGQCPSCKFVFCGICRFGWHGVDNCRIRSSELKKTMELYINGTDDDRRRLDDQYGKKYLCSLRDEHLSMGYLEENSKKCPRCMAKIEKIDGCNKMTCLRCNIYFCWLCMNILSYCTPYAHYNDRKSPCYNQLFAGMAEDPMDNDSDDDDDD